MQEYLGYAILIIMFIFSGYGAWHTTRNLRRFEKAEEKKRRIGVYRLAEKQGLLRLERSERTGILYSK